MLVEDDTRLKRQMAHYVNLISHHEAEKNSKRNMDGARIKIIQPEWIF